MKQVLFEIINGSGKSIGHTILHIEEDGKSREIGYVLSNAGVTKEGDKLTLVRGKEVRA